MNDFKYINDNFGHDFGDKILIEVSKILKQTYQNYGKCYRIGGDEFAVIMQTGLEDAEKVSDSFVKELELSREKIKELPHVSWGYSEYIPENKNERSIKDTKQEADDRMYENKKEFKRKKEKP